MKLNTKRIVAAFIAVMSLTAITAYAEWEFAGYDTRDLDNIGKMYNERLYGSYTSKTKVDPIEPWQIVWKFEGYEYDYPHAGYDRLYLENNAQMITRHNNLFPQWETRMKDYMWEVCGDHIIYQRQQTKIPGKGWAWDFSNDVMTDLALCTPTNRTATVTEEFRPIGFANLDVNGNLISPEVRAMYNYFGINTSELDYIFDVDNPDNYFNPVNLSEINPYNGQYVHSDDEIAEMVASIQSKFVTGPSFHNDNPTKDVAALYIENADKNWAWDYDTVRFGGGKIAWTNPTYEMEEPYKQYQVLAVNGVVLDGTGDKPYVYRYTDGKANPKIEWRYLSWTGVNDEFAELRDAMTSYPFPIIEWKYIDGKPAYNLDGSPVLRIPTGGYGNAYIKVTDKEIQMWLRNGREADTMIAAVSRVNHPLGGYEGFVPGAVFTLSE